MQMVCGGCASVVCDGVHGDHRAVGRVALAGWWTCVQMIHRGQWEAWHVVSDGVRLLQHWHDVCWGGRWSDGTTLLQDAGARVQGVCPS